MTSKQLVFAWVKNKPNNGGKKLQEMKEAYKSFLNSKYENSVIHIFNVTNLESPKVVE